MKKTPPAFDHGGVIIGLARVEPGQVFEICDKCGLSFEAMDVRFLNINGERIVLCEDCIQKGELK